MYPPLTTHNSLLGVNLFVLGGLVVLMALRGPTTASVLLLVGTLGMAIGKIGRAWTAGEWVRNSGRCLREQVFLHAEGMAAISRWFRSLSDDTTG